MAIVPANTIIDMLTKTVTDQKSGLSGIETWNGLGVLGQKLNISYSIISSSPNYYNTPTASFDFDKTSVHILTEGQRVAVNFAITNWESVANIDFINAGDNHPNADITIGQATLLNSTASPRRADSYAFTYNDQITNNSLFYQGDIWVNGNPDNRTGYAMASNQFVVSWVMLHEIGHALGLDHPNGKPLTQDIGHTVMSYMLMDGRQAPLEATEEYLYKPMLYDILAIQTMYGVNPDTNAKNNNSYIFKKGVESIQAIWDAGGTGDEINASDQTNSVTINLTPGEFSFVGMIENTSQQRIAIAYQVKGYENNWIENAIGGSGNDELTGNTSDNSLNGKNGSDSLRGGKGNDTYIVDNTGDIIIENSTLVTEIDTVNSSANYMLGANLENLTLTETAAINGTGNSLNNVLTGNAVANVLTGGGGNDTLNGGSGVDTLVGGVGNDTYIVGNVGDVTTEASALATEIDTVNSSANYMLGANLENLTLTGTAAINGTGNSLNNVLTGNAAANVLTGGAGNDTLNGAVGFDTLAGGLGNDYYLTGMDYSDSIIEKVGEGIDTVNIIKNVEYGFTFDNIENLTIADSRTAPLRVDLRDLINLTLSKNSDDITLFVIEDTTNINTGAGSDIIRIQSSPGVSPSYLNFADLSANDKIDLTSLPDVLGGFYSSTVKMVTMTTTIDTFFDSGYYLMAPSSIIHAKDTYGSLPDIINSSTNWEIRLVDSSSDDVVIELIGNITPNNFQIV